MFELFKTLSEYNHITNMQVMNLLKTQSAEALEKKEKTFYPGVLDTVLHVMNSDQKWIRRFPQYYATAYSSEKLDTILAEYEKSGIKLSSRLDDLSKIRDEIDLEIINMLDALQEVDFNRVVKVDFIGKQIERKIWQFLMQMFNHHSHHRGQISLQLELIGAENDFSSMIGKVF